MVQISSEMKTLLISLSTFLLITGCANSGYHPHFISQEEVTPMVQEETR